MNECKSVTRRWKNRKDTQSLHSRSDLLPCRTQSQFDFFCKETNSIENQLHRIPSDVIRNILNHITCVQFCALDRKDVKLKTTVVGNIRSILTGMFIFKSIICYNFQISARPCAGENKGEGNKHKAKHCGE